MNVNAEHRNYEFIMWEAGDSKYLGYICRYVTGNLAVINNNMTYENTLIHAWVILNYIEKSGIELPEEIKNTRQRIFNQVLTLDDYRNDMNKIMPNSEEWKSLSKFIQNNKSIFFEIKE